jgi:hypothetical protein
VKAKAVTREDVEEAAAKLFDGATPLVIKDGAVVAFPNWRDLTPHVQSAILTAPLLAKAEEKCRDRAGSSRVGLAASPSPRTSEAGRTALN